MGERFLSAFWFPPTCCATHLFHVSHVVGPLGRGNLSDLTQIYQQKFGVGKKGTPWSRGYRRDQCCRGECGHGRAKLGVKEAKRMIRLRPFSKGGGNLEAEKPVGLARSEL